MNISIADNFAPDPRSHLLSYHRCHLRLSPHQDVNVSSIDKPTDRRSCSTFLSTSSQTPVGANTPRNYNPRPRYSYNSRHRLDMADSLKTINQELSCSED